MPKNYRTNPLQPNARNVKETLTSQITDQSPLHIIWLVHSTFTLGYINIVISVSITTPREYRVLRTAQEKGRGYNLRVDLLSCSRSKSFIFRFVGFRFDRFGMFSGVIAAVLVKWILNFQNSRYGNSIEMVVRMKASFYGCLFSLKLFSELRTITVRLAAIFSSKS